MKKESDSVIKPLGESITVALSIGMNSLNLVVWNATCTASKMTT